MQMVCSLGGEEGRGSNSKEIGISATIPAVITAAAADDDCDVVATAAADDDDEEDKAVILVTPVATGVGV